MLTFLGAIYGRLNRGIGLVRSEGRLSSIKLVGQLVGILAMVLGHLHGLLDRPVQLARRDLQGQLGPPVQHDLLDPRRLRAVGHR